MVSNKKTITRFGNIASVVLVIIIGATLAFTMNTAVSKIPIKSFFNAERTNAVWDWAGITKRTDQELYDASDFMYMHQINTTYVDVSYYADIVALTDAAAKSTQQKTFIQNLERYVSAMHRRGIKVFAAAGDTSWSKPEQVAKPLAIQQMVFDYNKSHTDKIAGIEYDIESYNQTGFPDASFTEKELVLNEFLDMVDALATKQAAYIKGTSDNTLELGFAIPYWYDNENQNIRSVVWHDKTGPVLYHLLDRLNTLPRSNVVVMAYRNAALGNDGAIYHSRTEVDYAQSKAPHVSVIIGFEVNNVEPAKITYYGRTHTELTSEANLIQTEFGKQNVFGGFAINDLAGYTAMGDGAQ